MSQTESKRSRMRKDFRAYVESIIDRPLVEGERVCFQLFLDAYDNDVILNQREELRRLDKKYQELKKKSEKREAYIKSIS